MEFDIYTYTYISTTIGPIAKKRKARTAIEH